MEPNKELTQTFSNYFTGYAYSMAILKDYCEVVAKIEGSTPEEVKARIKVSAEEIADKAKVEIEKLKEDSETGKEE